MGFMIREIDTERTFSSALTVDALRRALPPDAITRAIAQEGVGEVRERRLTMALIVWLVIALHLYPTVSIGGVLGPPARGLRRSRHGAPPPPTSRRAAPGGAPGRGRPPGGRPHPPPSADARREISRR